MSLEKKERNKKMIAMRKRGKTFREIAEKFGVAINVPARVWYRYMAGIGMN